MIRGGALMCADINMLTSTLLPNVLIEIGMPRAPFKRRVGDILTYFATPTPQAATPKVSAVALNTYAARPSDSETSLTTSPEYSSKPADSNLNYTSNCEELCSCSMRTRGAVVSG